MSGSLRHGSGPRSLSEIARSGGPTGSGSFVYDEATLRSLISKWVALADHYDGSMRRINLGAVEPPGLDFASEALSKSANTSGTAYLKYLEQNYRYCVEQAQLLQDTLDDYLGVEHQNVTELNKTDQPTGSQSGI
ncbi:hypothetical protein [Actinophytocola sp.]|uniref:hypothetical protein n=1 Tax=Actinophytocola sp. TaxID=1872138 RepID=UPI00389AE756